MSYTQDQLCRLVDDLRSQPMETEWIEFKVNNSDPTMLGQNISALANSATLHEKEKAYLVLGVDDVSHEILGTKFNPRTELIKKQEIENYIGTQLDPRINFVFHRFEYVPGTWVVILEIDAAIDFPVSFAGKVYIRVGSYTKPITQHRGKEKELWSKLDKKTFEKGIAMSDLEAEEVIALLNYKILFTRLKLPLPTNSIGVIDKLIDEDIVQKDKGLYAITNLGAILFAEDITKFDTIARKAMRIIVYKGKDKLTTILEQKGKKGYAVGFESMVQFAQTYAGSKEVIKGSVREQQNVYPDLAIREIIANALIHQDFSIGGAGPMVEIYESRIEISNPGVPLVDLKRIIDHAPRSRNEKLAGLMARLGFCEERGSGVDKIVIQCESGQLPAPLFRAEDDFTRATLYAYRSLRAMTRDDKIRATYFHTVIQFLEVGYMENNTLRERFGILKENYPTASNIIKLALDAGMIKVRDNDSTSKYVPYWA